MRRVLFSATLGIVACRVAAPSASTPPSSTPPPPAKTTEVDAPDLDAHRAVRLIRELVATVAGEPGHELDVVDALDAATSDEAMIDGILLAAARIPLAQSDELLHRIKRQSGTKALETLREAYASLRVLTTLSDAKTDALPEAIRPHIVGAQKRWTARRDDVWNAWLGVPSHALALASSDPRVAPVLMRGQALMGIHTPSTTFADALDPELRALGTSIATDEPLFRLLTNKRTPRQRKRFLAAPRARWTIAAPGGRTPHPDTHFSTTIEYVGDGIPYVTFVFDSALSEEQLRRTLIRALIFQSLLSDSMLFTAGIDFAEVGPDGHVIELDEQVPKKHRAAYAACGSAGALDTLLLRKQSPSPMLHGLAPVTTTEDAVLEQAHRCVLAAVQADIAPAPPESLVRGPATRLALFQMLARFEEPIDLDTLRTR